MVCRLLRHPWLTAVTKIFEWRGLFKDVKGRKVFVQCSAGKAGKAVLRIQENTIDFWNRVRMRWLAKKYGRYYDLDWVPPENLMRTYSCRELKKFLITPSFPLSSNLISLSLSLSLSCQPQLDVDGHPMNKGLRTVGFERGHWDKDGKVAAQPKALLLEEMRNVLRKDPDFAKNPTILQQIFADFESQYCKFSMSYLTKFWCTLAWIEQYWNDCKQVFLR